MALVPTYRNGLLLKPIAENSNTFGVLNQVDPRRRLSRATFPNSSPPTRPTASSASSTMTKRWPKRPRVARSIVEAGPQSLSAVDIEAIAGRLDRITSPEPVGS
ncbi:hypothetical protein ACRAWD_26960 [Caulobacter segnis]